MSCKSSSSMSSTFSQNSGKSKISLSRHTKVKFDEISCSGRISNVSRSHYSKKSSVISGLYSDTGTIYTNVSSEEKPKGYCYFVGIKDCEIPNLIEKPENYNFRDEGVYQKEKMDNQWINTPDVIGLVSQETFFECQQIYENNQVYLEELYSRDLESLDDIVRKALNLEEWFYLIVEPFVEGDGWYEREYNYKLKNKYTSCCSTFFRKKMRPVSDEIVEKLGDIYFQQNLS